MSYWKPIAEGKDRIAVEEALLAIAADLGRPRPPSEAYRRTFGWNGAALYEGRAGLALFFASLWQWNHEDGYLQLAKHNLTRALLGIQFKPMDSTLFHGVLGIAWVLQRVNGWVVDYDLEAFKSDLYPALDMFLDRPAEASLASDFIRGDIGVGFYLLQNSSDPAAQYLLEKVVSRLEATSQKLETGIAWLTKPELLGPDAIEQFPNGAFNLGLAHGIPAVIAFLSQLCGLQNDNQGARHLLQGAVEWMLSQKLPQDCESTFPTLVAAGCPPSTSKSARLAWCYGDLGIALAILAAARALGDKSWEKSSIAIGHKAAARPLDRSGVEDAALCHGAGGVAHMFNRFYQSTGDPMFRSAAQTWLKRTIAYRSQTGPGGFRAATTDASGAGRWEIFPGFLAGAAGIGLALLSSLSRVEPFWDEVLLLAVPEDRQLTYA